MGGVTVIVPCYKVEKYIGELIKSIQSQTFSDMEIILVDDGSTDKTGSICDEYAAKDDRITVIHKPNGGVSAARNDGLAKASGKYVLFCDSDDYLPYDALEALYMKAEQTDADIVIGDVTLKFPHKEVKEVFYSDDFVTDKGKEKEELLKAVFYKAYNPRPYRGGDAATFAYGSVWNKLIRREILVDNQIRFDESVFGIFDDVIFSAYILAAAKKVAYIQKNVYYYRMLDNSITHTYKGNMLEINQAIFNSWDTFLQKYDPKGIYKSACYANILRRFDDSLTRYFFNDDNPKSKAEIIKELSVIIHSKPYCDIPKFVDKDLLGKRLRAECELIEKGSAQRVSLFYKLLSLYRRCR